MVVFDECRDYGLTLFGYVICLILYNAVLSNFLVEDILFAVFCFCFCFFFRTTPMAYGGSQARGQIGAAAAGLHHSHSHTISEPCL